jgi:hypothetical protein
VCAADGQSSVCGAQPGASQPEACDGKDNDCNTVADNGCDDDLDGYCDAAITFAPPTAAALTVCPQSNASTLDCNDEDDAIHPGAAEVCRDGRDQNCDGENSEGCPVCNPAVDADFDGSNECEDCDETNGAVRPDLDERCDGLDQDCNGEIDETFDGDDDGYTTCGTVLPGGGLDPSYVDCADGDPTRHPFACELCANAAGNVACGQVGDRGNVVDEDCDGYVDETCAPCSTSDPDGDGSSQCDGDCAPSDPNVRPGLPEVCEGKDTDCNTFTTENCGVGDPCLAGGLDVCQDGLFCVQEARGTSVYCSSPCNFSFLGGGLGDGCQSDEICIGLTPTANLGGCTPSTDIGTAGGGATCGSDADCRSSSCLKQFGVKKCIEHCGSDDYCTVAGTKCQAIGTNFIACWPTTSTQTRVTGDSCTTTTDAAKCQHGTSLCIDMGGAKRCSEPCCTNSDCPTDFYCSLNAPTSASTQVNGYETTPACYPESTGNGGRQAGAACTTNGQCASEFCDKNLDVCVDVCCNDDTCPLGLTCEQTRAAFRPGQEGFMRACLSVTPTSPLEKR